MKTSQGVILTGIAIIILAAATPVSAIIGLGIEWDCADIVLSWPSTGNEHYLIQYRPTFDPSTPWQNLTNNYPANSTNHTTYRIFNVVPPCPSGSTSSLMMATASESLGPVITEPQVMPADGSRRPVPLAIYPPGIDLSGHNVIWPDGTSEAWSAKLVESYTANKKLSSMSASLSSDLPLLEGAESNSGNGGGGSGNTADCGFFRVFHIPDFPNSITNYVFDGPTFIPADFKDYVERVKGIELRLDGQPTELADFIPYVSGGQTNWGMGIYFDRIASGTHQIQLVTTIQLDDLADDDAVFLVLSNLTRTITLDNQVTFTNWDTLVWNNSNYLFKAQTKNPDTDWAIDIYDAWGFWINGTSGHTFNGHIEWTWDLTDFNSNLRDNISFDPFFDPWITFNESGTSSAAGTNGSAAAGAPTSRPTPVPILAYPDEGAWVIAFQNNFYPSGTSSHDKMVAAMSAIQGWVNYRDVTTQYHPLAYGTNNTTQEERNESWAILKNNLLAFPEFRNFYYFGHGSPNSMGGDMDYYDTNGLVVGSTSTAKSKARLTAPEVKSDVTFNKRIGEHHYRFVWLDGCNTAEGGWPDAFGVNKATNSLSYYNSSVTNPSRKRPSAFVGWATKPGGEGWGTVTGFFNARSEWIKQWSYYWQTESLVDAMEFGRNNSNWIPQSKFWDGIRVYGYNELKMNFYNKKTDWPPQ